MDALQEPETHQLRCFHQPQHFGLLLGGGGGLGGVLRISGAEDEDKAVGEGEGELQHGEEVR